MMISSPLYGNLIDERADKYIYVDAASSTGVLGGVLLQKIGNSSERYVPESLNLEDEVHSLIYDHQLPYEPATLYTSLPIELPKPSLRKIVPPNVHKELPLLGYTEENVMDSFFWSVVSVLALYNCKLPTSIDELKSLAVKNLKSGTLNNKLKDFVFNLNYNDYANYL
jgi:hypothetical protein